MSCGFPFPSRALDVAFDCAVFDQGIGIAGCGRHPCRHPLKLGGWECNLRRQWRLAVAVPW